VLFPQCYIPSFATSAWTQWRYYTETLTTAGTSEHIRIYTKRGNLGDATKKVLLSVATRAYGVQSSPGTHVAEWGQLQVMTLAVKSTRTHCSALFFLVCSLHKKRIQDVTPASMKTIVCWDVASCGLVEVYGRFRGACSLLHQGGDSIAKGYC
jgi:hypothetical protein